MTKLMISYSWGYKKETVNALYKFHVGKGYDVWKDDEGSRFKSVFGERTGNDVRQQTLWVRSLKGLNLVEGGLQGHVIDGMAEAVENCDFMIVCVSQAYFESKNCKKEIEYADDLGKTYIVVKLDPKLNIAGHGSFSMILSNQLYVCQVFIKI